VLKLWFFRAVMMFSWTVFWVVFAFFVQTPVSNDWQWRGICVVIWAYLLWKTLTAQLLEENNHEQERLER
jgi:hypothetical protein